MKPLCIYHDNCADGFTAAWVVNNAFDGKIEFHAGVYQQPPPDVTNRDVILVDFSYKRPVLEAMIAQASSVTILDHHKTAEADLKDLVGATTVFDMTRSGCRITWDYYFPSASPPQLLLHVEDRDLWKFSLYGTREIQAAVFSYPYDFAVWDMLMRSNIDNLREDGEAIERKHFKDINELLPVVTRPMNIATYKVLVANLPYTFSSDAAHKLAKDKPFGACYYDTPEGRVFSLRSDGNGIDVSEVAKIFGGGGHKHAAGFKIDFEYAELFEMST